MYASLTITRYRKLFIPFAFLAMAIHRLPLFFNKRISFYKLLGCGKNGTFDRVPDLQQWGILSVYKALPASDKHELLVKELYGSFISGWFKAFKCETFTILLEPVEGHGLWDGKPVFADLPKSSDHEGPVAVLTRATIRLNKLKYFWQHMAPVSEKMNTANGFIISFGIGETIWRKQATFSIWETKAAMLEFAYGTKEHQEVIKRTKDEQWYSEEMFVRFRVLAKAGSIGGIDPLEGKL